MFGTEMIRDKNIYFSVFDLNTTVGSLITKYIAQVCSTNYYFAKRFFFYLEILWHTSYISRFLNQRQIKKIKSEVSAEEAYY